MRSYLTAIGISVVGYIASAMLLGSIHYFLYNLLPEEGIAGDISSSALVLLSFVPALLAGYISGQLIKTRGMIFGALSVSLGVGILHGVIFSASGSGGISQHILAVLIGALAGGCGELHANRKSA